MAYRIQLCHRRVNRMEQRDCCPVIRHIEGELFRDVSMDANDPVVHAHIVFASFSSISARVFTARQTNPLPKERLTITEDAETLLRFVQQHEALINGQVEEERLRVLLAIKVGCHVLGTPLCTSLFVRTLPPPAFR
ncbi:uncharacterized protein EI90DRAFT_3088378 [Cantharellus anzutake]|uniref:uncharacterized protein n=1 Tax=Cantharellus anzutake TaxID=1750568 RepID=UPI0019064A7B|nr:uncharacterized protein EI90DRAFT_3088378 [Cantharellus anzutake]KAF8315266.1 hypothetical protein EI90DRAFT_3088378 [Cantharellus anzutake]